MKKAKRILGLGLAIGLAAAACILLWGWRWFGYALCTDPENFYLSEIYHSDSTLALSGSAPDQAYYQGYVTAVEGETMYIGIRFVKYIPVSLRHDFYIQLELPETVKQVYIVGGDNQIAISV